MQTFYNPEISRYMIGSGLVRYKYNCWIDSAKGWTDW